MAPEDGARRTLGRPPKFDEPCRVVTVTLPERTLDDLAMLDRDRARAIVKASTLARQAANGDAAPRPSNDVDLVRVAPDSAIIALSSSRPLAEIPGLTLVEFQPSRFLVIVDPAISLADVEIAIVDRMETFSPDMGKERDVLRQILDHLRSGRRSKRIRTGSIILVDVG
jgi:hypothetical protein